MSLVKNKHHSALAGKAPLYIVKIGSDQKPAPCEVFTPASSIAEIQKPEDVMSPTLNSPKPFPILEMKTKLIKLNQGEETECEVISPLSINTQSLETRN